MPGVLKGCLVAAIVVIVLGLFASEGPNRAAYAADGCSDFDGDGFVHISDQVMFSVWHFFLVPPAPPQVDSNKDETITIADQDHLASQLFMNTSCQTDPLPKTTLAGGALALVYVHALDDLPGDPLGDLPGLLDRQVGIWADPHPHHSPIDPPDAIERPGAGGGDAQPAGNPL